MINGTVNYADGAGDDARGSTSPTASRSSGMLQDLLVAAVQHRVWRCEPAGHDEPSAGRWRAVAAELRRARPSTFIQRNAGTGSDFFTLNLRVSRTFRLGNALKARGLVEAFNVTNRVNNLTRNTTWGPGAYPSIPCRRSTGSPLSAIRARCSSACG